MDSTSIFLLNSFSIGSLIAIFFFFTISLFLLSIKKRLPATTHIGLAYALLGLFNVGYFISSTIYHPLAAYHRWITVLAIFLTQAHMAVFFFYFPSERNPRAARYLLKTMYTVYILVLLVFVVVSLQSPKVYLFMAHYWDFQADKLSSVIGLLIVFNVFLGTGLSIWRCVTSRGKERWVVLLVGVLYFITTFVPAVANTISRQGIIGRATFQNIWVLFNVIGFFLIIIVYINNSRERISFIGKLIGISIITFLTMMQVISYSIMQEKEDVFDRIYSNYAALSAGDIKPDVKPLYRASYSFSEDAFKTEPWESNTTEKSTLKNSLFWQKIEKIEADNFIKDASALLKETPPEFRGYRATIMHILESDVFESDTPIESLRQKMKPVIKSSRRFRKEMAKIKTEEDLASLPELVRKKYKPLVYFIPALQELGSDRESSVSERAGNIFSLFTPLYSVGERNYRTGKDGTHSIEYFSTGREKNTLFRIGFNYTTFRKYMHSTSLTFIIILVVLLVVVRFGFQYFFLGTLVNPLLTLSEGVGEVNRGNLKVRIPIKQEDEIGYITHTFNKMAETLENIVHAIADNSSEIKSVSGDLNDSSSTLNDIARELTAIVEETAASYEEMSATFDSNLSEIKIQLEQSEMIHDDISNINTESEQLSERISGLTRHVNEAVEQIEDGEKTINRSVTAIEELAAYLRDIEGTINSINELADKINLLALNAAIEAARAGEHGKGFAVVADEVNKLADQTAEVVKGIQSTLIEQANQMSSELHFVGSTSQIFTDIRGKIIAIQQVLGDTIDFTRSLGGKNRDIHEKTEKLGEISNNVYNYSGEQKGVIEELTKAINSINELTQTTLSNAEMVRSYAKIVGMAAKQLAENVDSFNENERDAGSDTFQGMKEEDSL